MDPGKAYGFFNCDASYEQINSELPYIRQITQTPSGLELLLHESPDKIVTNDENLRNIIQDAKSVGRRYALEATYPGNSNKQAADEVATVLNQMYQTLLYKENEEFYGEILFKECDTYVFRD